MHACYDNVYADARPIIPDPPVAPAATPTSAFPSEAYDAHGARHLRMRVAATLMASASTRHRPQLYRYDPRSWYYNSLGYYPYYNSGYWVPRAEMRYRCRYVYYGLQYRYYRSWGYGFPATYCRRW